jgi:flavin reductase (DIM6/NTAB) family NADH-FMN oxidoreductase RutF
MTGPEKFREVMSYFATGVTVVTTRDRDGRPYGLTVSAFTSVSLDPLLVLVCLDNRLSGLQAFKDSMNFGVSILSEAQEDLSRLFAKKDSERPPDIYFDGPAGIPLLRQSLATMECETAAMYPGGDHTIFMGKAVSLDVLEGKNGARPLLYFRSKYHRLT